MAEILGRRSSLPKAAVCLLGSWSAMHHVMRLELVLVEAYVVVSDLAIYPAREIDAKCGVALSPNPTAHGSKLDF